ncbi:hypothetical protein Lal_00009263 [Lupinus albus]|nr:hypothetical protein Lal_00009263 [Lupinus albus]
MQERHTQELCYNCNEKFHYGHKWEQKKFLLLLVVEFPTGNGTQLLSLEPLGEEFVANTDELLNFQLSEQALEGSIVGHPVAVLVDSCISHNIIQHRLAHYLLLIMDPTPNFLVMIGNRAHIYCSGFCANTPIILQNQLFHFHSIYCQSKGKMLCFA